MALLYFSLFIVVISYVGTVCYGNKIPVDEFTKAFRDIDADRDDKITLEEVSYLF
jgi:Ca2+-binding EF-hand superfamily protein